MHVYCTCNAHELNAFFNHYFVDYNDSNISKCGSYEWHNARWGLFQFDYWIFKETWQVCWNFNVTHLRLEKILLSAKFITKIRIVIATMHSVNLLLQLRKSCEGHTYVLYWSYCCVSLHAAAGGSYSLVARNLGPECGGAVGVFLFFSNAFGSTLYLLGAMEVLIVCQLLTCSWFHCVVKLTTAPWTTVYGI